MLQFLHTHAFNLMQIIYIGLENGIVTSRQYIWNNYNYIVNLSLICM